MANRARERSTRFAKLWCDSGFKRSFIEHCRNHHVGVEVVKRIHPSRFEVLPKRWIVERTWSWLMNSRRLQVDYERDPIVTEGFIWAAHSRYLMRRLTQEPIADHAGETIARLSGPWVEVATSTVVAPFAGTVLSVAVGPGDRVHVGQSLLIIESMKMEHEVVAVHSGTVRRVAVGPGDAVAANAVLIEVEEGAVSAPEEEAAEVPLPRRGAARAGRAAGTGGQHPRCRSPRRDGSSSRRRAEDGPREHRRPLRPREFRRVRRPGGGGTAGAPRPRRPHPQHPGRRPDCRDRPHQRGPLRRCACTALLCVSYDYTVLAGTQGQMNHRKKDRLFALIERLRLPVVLFAEGGGGRPGDTDTAVVTGLDTEAFALFGGLSGLVPLVGIVSGRCFAGNAALLGCCDVIIATPDANIGMGGPAMIEGGGLGVFAPEEIGPRHVQVLNGVVDVEADDEADAVRLAKQYLSYFQGALMRMVLCRPGAPP